MRLAPIRVNGTVGATKARDNLIRQVLLRPTVFKDEAPLSLEYIPAKLPHREDKLTFLAHLFRSPP